MCKEVGQELAVEFATISHPFQFPTFIFYSFYQRDKQLQNNFSQQIYGFLGFIPLT